MKMTEGKYYVLEYDDASYFYVDVVAKKIKKPERVYSVGRVRRFTDNFVDLVLTWDFDDENIFHDGIIIPKKTIHRIEQIKPYEG